MTGTLEAPIYPPVEEGAAQESADKTPDGRSETPQGEGEDELARNGFESSTRQSQEKCGPCLLRRK